MQRWGRLKLRIQSLHGRDTNFFLFLMLVPYENLINRGLLLTSPVLIGTHYLLEFFLLFMTRLFQVLIQLLLIYRNIQRVFCYFWKPKGRIRVFMANRVRRLAQRWLIYNINSSQRLHLVLSFIVSLVYKRSILRISLMNRFHIMIAFLLYS